MTTIPTVIRLSARWYIGFNPEFGRYSGVLLDIYFDYLLASRFESFSGGSLRKYTRNFYLSLLINYRYLPLRFKRFIWHFIPDRPFAEIRHSERNKRIFEHHGGISSY
ncbi:acyl carrier protein phosphodiesterase [Bacteroides uniformis]|nr:acyl carrier protein phosphodiesterase [Bacteroides uniformis]